MNFLFPLLFLVPFLDGPSSAEVPTRVLIEVPAETDETDKHERRTIYLAFENLGVFDPLPLYTRVYKDGAFVKWARAQNQMAYRIAREKADNWVIRNPALDVYVQDNDYISTSDLDQDEGGTSNGASVGATSSTRYFGHSVQRTYRPQTRWGGGPVVLVNPYVRP